MPPIIIDLLIFVITAVTKCSIFFLKTANRLYGRIVRLLHPNKNIFNWYQQKLKINLNWQNMILEDDQ